MSGIEDPFDEIGDMGVSTGFEAFGHGGFVAFSDAPHGVVRTREETEKKYRARRDSDAGQARILRYYLAAKLGIWTAGGNGDATEAAHGLALPLLAAANGVSTAQAYKLVEDLRGVGGASQALGHLLSGLRRDGAELLNRYPTLNIARPEPGPPRDLSLQDVVCDEIAETNDSELIQQILTDLMSGRIILANLKGVPRHVVAKVLAQLEAMKKHRGKIDLRIDDDVDVMKGWLGSLEFQSLIGALRAYLQRNTEVGALATWQSDRGGPLI